jgi:hypothetical protein
MLFHVKRFAVRPEFSLVAESRDHPAFEEIGGIVDQEKAGRGESEILSRAEEDGIENFVKAYILGQEPRNPEY